MSKKDDGERQPEYMPPGPAATEVQRLRQQVVYYKNGAAALYAELEKCLRHTPAGRDKLETLKRWKGE